MGETEAGLSVLILAGGSSTRMGRDKAWLELDGQPLVERVARRVLTLAAELIFSTNTPAEFSALADRLPLPVQLVPDDYAGGGPLAGLHAGLSAAKHHLVLALAADMPFVNAALLRYLVTLAPGYDAVVPLVFSPNTGQSEWEPLHAVYRRSCLPAIEACLAAGRRRTISFLGDVQTRAVPAADIVRFDPDFLSFRNVNIPEELEDARRIITPPAASPDSGLPT